MKIKTLHYTAYKSCGFTPFGHEEVLSNLRVFVLRAKSVKVESEEAMNFCTLYKLNVWQQV